jgi:hypothetical protein
MSAPYWIVLAWVSMDGVELTGRYLDRLQQVRETRLAPKAKACTWLHGPEVNAKEITRAKAFAAANQYQCMTFPKSVKEPLDAARAIVLAKFANKKAIHGTGPIAEWMLGS